MSQDYCEMNVKKVTGGTHFVKERVDPDQRIQQDAPPIEPQKLPNKINIDELSGGCMFVNRCYAGNTQQQDQNSSKEQDKENKEKKIPQLNQPLVEMDLT